MLASSFADVSCVQASDTLLTPNAASTTSMKRSRAEKEDAAGDSSAGEADAAVADCTSSDSYPSVSLTQEDGNQEDDSDDQSDAEDTVVVDFEFFDPQPDDYLGLKAVLKNLLDGEEFHCSELVDTILKQDAVGTVLKAGEDEDPIGVTTVLSLGQYRHLESLTELRQFLDRHIADDMARQQLSESWGAKATGLIINERLLNCPPQLGPPLQEALFDEIQWACQNGPEESREFFDLQQFILISRVYRDPAGISRTEPSAGGRPHKRHQHRAKPNQHLDAALVYVKPEDEFYHKQCSWASLFLNTSRSVAKDELQPLRIVMAMSADQARVARQELRQALGGLGAAPAQSL